MLEMNVLLGRLCTRVLKQRTGSKELITEVEGGIKVTGIWEGPVFVIRIQHVSSSQKVRKEKENVTN